MPRISSPGLKSVGDFDISVAAYPEVHPEAPSPQLDLDNLKRKIDAGATRAITQFFYDMDRFLRFRDRCDAGRHRRADRARASCRSRAFRRCCASRRSAAPRSRSGCSERFAGLDDDPETRRLIAASVAIEQVQAARATRRAGVPLLHAESRRAHLCHLPRAGRAA